MCSSLSLADWQRDVVEIVRNEMLYFVPQMQTKILNEGWASYWHQRIVRDLELSDREYVEFAQMNAGVLAPAKHEMNPYHVGLKILEDVEGERRLCLAARFEREEHVADREHGETHRPRDGRAVVVVVRPPDRSERRAARSRQRAARTGRARESADDRSGEWRRSHGVRRAGAKPLRVRSDRCPAPYE